MTERCKNFFVFFVVFSFFLGAISPAFAADAKNEETGLEISFEDLGLREPKILPGDTFYFLKKWQRGIRQAFSFGDLRKASFRSDLMNEFIAEAKALEDRGNSENGLKIAFQNYRDNAARLKERISSLKETSGNKKVDKLLGKLADRFVKHEAVFEEITDRSAFEEEFKKAKEELEVATAEAVTKLESPETFENRFQEVISSLRENDLKELRVVYALNYIEEKLPEEIRSKIRELETDLISGFEGRFKAQPEEVRPSLNFIPINNARNLSVFDEVRERVVDSSLKSELNVVRQSAVRSGNGGIVEGETLVEIIHEAEAATGELKKRISSEEYVSSKSVEELLERAEFHLTQANDLLAQGNEATAFGQATAASATAESGLSQLRPKEEIEKDNLLLRVKFDELSSLARSKQFTRSSVPELYDRFDEVEKVIVAADTASEIRDAKVMLAEIEVLIVNNR